MLKMHARPAKAFPLCAGSGVCSVAAYCAHCTSMPPVSFRPYLNSDYREGNYSYKPYIILTTLSWHNNLLEHMHVLLGYKAELSQFAFSPFIVYRGAYYLTKVQTNWDTL